MADQFQHCPDEDTIRRLFDEELPDDESEALLHHLTTCSTCQKRHLREAFQEPGSVIPGYLLLEELGRGLASVVYKAWRLKGKPRLVALKLMWPANDEQKARFQREIEVQSRLDSPNIVKCLDSGSEGVMVYYAMELVHGLPLDEYLNRHASTLDEKLAVFQRVCQALAGAHARGVAHRDLKPTNVLVDSAGQPHILDFGLCAAVSAEWSTWVHKTQTRPGDVIGTVKYMSPEQAWGGLLGGSIDFHADIWALGVMLYEIATGGDYPYKLGPTADKPAEEALLYRIRTETPKPANVESPGVGHDLKKLIERCLAWDKEQRIQSVAALAEDVGRCRAKIPVKTRSLPYRYRLRRIFLGMAVKQRWLLWIANITAVLLVLSAVTFVCDIRWSVTGHDYTSESREHESIAAAGNSRDNIVVIGISDRTIRKVCEIAPRRGFSTVTSDIKTWRALHGHIMKRLAAAPPKVVAWDYYFRTPQPGDGDFVAGVRALHDVQTAVVFAVQKYKQGNNPDLSPDIYQPLEHISSFGGILARDMVEREGEFVIVVGRDGETRPSLALSTVAALLHPDRRLVVDWSGRDRQIYLVYEERGRVGSVLRQRDRIGLTTVYATPRDEHSSRAGDMLACKAFELQRPELWEKRTVSYEDILTATDEELRAMVMGKIVLFGNLRGPSLFRRHDRHRVRYGSDILDNVPGVYLMADAVNGLLANDYLKSAFPLSGSLLFLVGSSALAACLVSIPLVKSGLLRNRRSRMILLVAALGLSLACCVAMTKTRQRSWIYLAVAGAAICLAAPAPFRIEFARTPHHVSQPSGERYEP